MARATVEALLLKIAADKPAPVILLLGHDRYSRDALRAKLIEATVPAGARDWGVVRVSCREMSVEKIIQQAQMLPMLCPRQIIIASELEAVQRLGEDSREEALDALKAYLHDPASFSSIVFEAEELDQRMSIFKLLAEKAFLVEIELAGEGPERDAAAVDMAQNMAKDSGVDLTEDAARLLADLVNCEPARMATEINKLATFVAPRKEISQEDVYALVISEKKYSVWKLAEILAAREPNQALIFLDSVLREGEEPPAIVGALAWMYRRLVQAQDLPANLQGWQAARQLHMRPETAELALCQSRRISKDRLLQGLKTLYEADSMLKSGFGNDRAVLEFIVAELGA